jgi:hypothetical protein
MLGNDRASGARRPRKHQAVQLDPVCAEAYRGLDTADIRRVAVAYWGDLAAFAYWCYDSLNGPFFAGRVRHPLFQFCRVMPYGHCIGLSHTGDLDRPVIDVFLSLWTRQDRPHVKVFGVVAHEMMHFDASARWREAGAGRYRTSHDNEFWLAGVERISPLLGVDLGAIGHPYQHWPEAGWAEGQKDRMEEMLKARRFPAAAAVS